MFQHLRGNAIAYAALFVALGGTAFAASKVTSGDIKDNTIRGKDIKTNQVAGSDLRDDSATGDDVADGSLDGGEIQDGSLTGSDIADKSIGGSKVDPATKVPNADTLDGHGSTRYGVGLQMGVATALSNGPNFRFPVGITGAADEGLKAVSPEVLELRDFTATLHDTGPATTVNVELDGASGTPLLCPLSPGTPTCHLASNVQHEIPGPQNEWSLKFTTTSPDAGDYVTFAYRAVR